MGDAPDATRTAAPRWLVDEMLGRLARYLRFLGHDTEYVRGLPDEAIGARALRERRILVTRDRLLSRRTPGAVLVETTDVLEQLRVVLRSYPSASREVRFDRCTLCNGELRPRGPAPEGALGSGPPDVPRFRCEACGHEYWEGSHTAAIRRRLAGVLEAPA